MLRDLAPHDQGDDVLLTEASWGPETRRRMVVDDGRAAGRAALAEAGAAGVAGSSGWRETLREGPAEVQRESAGPERHRRRRIGTAERLTGGGFFANSRRYRGVGLRH
jgi:hypothetical protein